MTSLGHIFLLAAFVACGFAATACWGSDKALRVGIRSRWVAGLAGVVSLTLTCLVLAVALIKKDFAFAYVAQYTDGLLPWHYSLSAFWVGQAGSLLLWCWFSAIAALAFVLFSKRLAIEIRARAFGIQMAVVCILTAIMIFAADPMQASSAAASNGRGLSPLLQHPAMLIHPPFVFLGYALWTLPFSLAAAAMLARPIDAGWIPQARLWALLAWTSLGVGILLGANWAYEELGWGGYWAWDPVENGSLIPWLTGTAFIHALMTWQYRGIFKKTCLATGAATFALCQFAAFLTRSGQFSSVHAFSRSAIGCLLLGLAVAIALGSGVLMVRSRSRLVPDRKIDSIASREAAIAAAMLALLALASLTLVGTVITPLSGLLSANRIVVGTQFYNNVLVPTGLVLAAITPAAPLLPWGQSPFGLRRRILIVLPAMLVAGLLAAGLVAHRHPMELAIFGLALWAPVAVVAHLGLESSRRYRGALGRRLAVSFAANRRQYAGFVIHTGFMLAVVGIAGSSLGTQQHDVELTEGGCAEFAGYSVRYNGVHEILRPEKRVVEAELQVTAGDGSRFVLNPAQHFHYRQDEWTSEVAIDSSWERDFYAIVHAGETGKSANFSFRINPRMRWLWASGWFFGLGAAMGAWPPRRRAAPPARGRGVSPPHWQRKPLTAARLART